MSFAGRGKVDFTRLTDARMLLDFVILAVRSDPTPA